MNNLPQVTRAENNKSYSFVARFNRVKDARIAALKSLRSSDKHVYYTRVQEKGVVYYDLRKEN